MSDTMAAALGVINRTDRNKQRRAATRGMRMAARTGRTATQAPEARSLMSTWQWVDETRRDHGRRIAAGAEFNALAVGDVLSRLVAGLLLQLRTSRWCLWVHEYRHALVGGG